jgi:hypothetical protein
MPTLLRKGQPDAVSNKKQTVRFPAQEKDVIGDIEEGGKSAAHQGRSWLSLGKKSKSFFSERSNSRVETDMSAYTDVEDVEEGIEKTSWCWFKVNCFAGEGFCHCCYLLIFIMFVLFVPLFLKWMVSAPKPPEFRYPKPTFPHRFPLLEDWNFVQEQRGNDFGLWMSPIPTNDNGCNFSSCAAGKSADQSLLMRASTQMNFDVKIKLEAPQFNHTAYPVLISSDNFEDWTVVADRRHAQPQPYFPSVSQQFGHVYNYVTEKCTRPPELLPGMPAPAVERFSEVPTYVLVCVAWTRVKVDLHRWSNSIEGSDLGEYCDAVGGVGGWPCQNHPPNMKLPGCNADGVVDVDNEAGMVGGVRIPGARFSGQVSLRACMSGTSGPECVTKTETFSRWRCHKCHNATDNMTMLYDSLPPMEVILKNADIQKRGAETMDPQAFILTSPLAENGLQAEGFQSNEGGVFKKLYDYDIYPLPIPVQELPEPGTTTTEPSALLDASRHTMRFKEHNQLTIKPEWCFGKRGPLYLVACIVNTSTHADKFQFMPGQSLGKPPFNDRCLAVTGRCAHACFPEQHSMPHCSADGTITQSDLVGDTDTATNDETTVYVFVWTLLIGFAVKVWYYVPGMFTPYKRAEFYSPKMTEQVKYIAVCAPSGGESKGCVLRNLVGAMSTLPTDCQCPFHVVFADEGHRHPQKVMFRSFVNVMQHIPEICVNSVKQTKRVKHGFKERNLKTFTTFWVEATKKLKLDECSTGAMATKIHELENEDVWGPGCEEMINKMNDQIDALSGVCVLKILQTRQGWPRGCATAKPGSPERVIFELEKALLQLRKELTCGEKTWDGTNSTCTRARDTLIVAAHLDDYEDYGWIDPEALEDPKPLYNLHYIARAKPAEDERKIKVQHVAQGVWCYSVPKKTESQDKKTWLQWRQTAEEFFPGEEMLSQSRYLVPLRTSRGKAGGLNFAENYLYDFHRRHEDPDAPTEGLRYQHAVFSIADARHQYQPDFFIETLPYFFRKDDQLNPKVAFTQCPQYFQEMPDDADYLDTNNSSFFRMGCMLRNCCGGVSSCGTNGTWLVRDRRAGKHGNKNIWELDNLREMGQGFTQVVERRFFHESCKVEDTASSLDRVVKGKYSQYITMRLSYGMAKPPTDYLAAIQRWAEGGVVLMWQTFLGSERGTYMIWMTFLLFLAFIVSIFFAIHTSGHSLVLGCIFRTITGDDSVLRHLEDVTSLWATALVPLLGQPETSTSDYQEMFFQILCWAMVIAFSILALAVITWFSYFAHHTTCCGRRPAARRTRFPTCLAQWARLMITVDNITYYFWCWTAFFWVGFNYYSVWVVKTYSFYPGIMSGFSWGLAVFNYGLLISASSRYKMAESTSGNELFVLSLTNIWRTTQLFYITAPLTIYSIIMGTLDFSRNKMFGEDISYWIGGDRGVVSKSIVQWWTLFLVAGSCFTWLSFLCGWLSEESSNVGSILIVSFIGLDVIHPCAFLWLGSQPEPLPKPDIVTATGFSGMIQRSCRRFFQLCFSMTFYRNCLRSFIFTPRFTGCMKWLGPMNQCVVQPVLTLFFPMIGVNTALLLLSTK